MPERMLQFVRLPQQTPAKRDEAVRRADFSEIYSDFDPREASAQSSRCSQCGVPFCQVHCPLDAELHLVIAAPIAVDGPQVVERPQERTRLPKRLG